MLYTGGDGEWSEVGKYQATSGNDAITKALVAHADTADLGAGADTEQGVTLVAVPGTFFQPKSVRTKVTKERVIE